MLGKVSFSAQFYIQQGNEHAQFYIFFRNYTFHVPFNEYVTDVIQKHFYCTIILGPEKLLSYQCNFYFIKGFIFCIKGDNHNRRFRH